MKKLLLGLVVGAIVILTIFGSVVLAARDGLAQQIVPPGPTAIIAAITPTPTDTPSPTIAATPASSLEPSISPTPVSTSTATPTWTPSPTVCPIPINWAAYRVTSFDTLELIAQRFSTTVDELVRGNCLPDRSVRFGQLIYVPSTLPLPTPTPCGPPPLFWVPYVVRPGDTLSALSIRFNVPLVVLMRANCLTLTSILRIGQTIYVPPLPPTPTPTPTLVPPTFTFTPTPITLTPTDTPTPTPTTPASTITDTPAPTATTVSPPGTGTPTPTDTLTPVPTPTNTLTPIPTDTPAPPTDTPAPTATLLSAASPSPVAP